MTPLALTVTFVRGLSLVEECANLSVAGLDLASASLWSLDVIKERALYPSLLLHLVRSLCFSLFLWTAIR